MTIADHYVKMVNLIFFNDLNIDKPQRQSELTKVRMKFVDIV